MNNQTKILLTVQGIEGSTLKPLGKKRVSWQITKNDIDPKYKGKDAFRPVRKGINEVFDFEVIPAKQSIKLTYDAYNYMTSTEKPEWFRGSWVKLTKKQRLESHLQRICDDRGGKSFIYSVLED